jgi:hypothetical protein
MQGPKRNHHVVPAFYLKGFGVEPDYKHVWEYCRKLPYKAGKRRGFHNPCLLSIKRKAGVIRDYYSYETLADGEKHEELENILEQQEQIGQEALRQIRAGAPIDMQGKVELSFYIEMMLMRVPSRMKEAAPLMDEAMGAWQWDLLARMAADEGRFAEALQLTRNRETARAKIKRELLRKGMTLRSSMIVGTIAKMAWAFLKVTDNQFFIATDNPAVFDRALGLGRENSWLVFPVSSRVALVARHSATPDISYLYASEDQVKQVNQQMLRSAEEHVYACKDEAWILEMWQDLGPQGIP